MSDKFHKLCFVVPVAFLAALYTVSTANAAETEPLLNNPTTDGIYNLSPTPNIGDEFEKTRALAGDTVKQIEKSAKILEAVSKNEGTLTSGQIDETVSYIQAVIDITGKDGSFFRKSDVFVDWLKRYRQEIESNPRIGQTNKRALLTIWDGITEDTIDARKQILKANTALKRAQDTFIESKPLIYLADVVDQARLGKEAHVNALLSLRKLVAKINSDIKIIKSQLKPRQFKS